MCGRKFGLHHYVVATIASLLLSFLLCYFVLDAVFIPDSISNTGHIVFRLLVAHSLWLTFLWIRQIPWTTRERKALFGLYCLFVLSLLLARDNLSAVSPSVNLRIGYIDDLSPFVCVANVLLFSPISFYICKKNAKQRLYGLAAVVALIVLVEFLQLLLRVGTFDVNDLILNFIGVTIGIVVHIVVYLWRNGKQHR